MRRYMAVAHKVDPHTVRAASGRLSYRRVYPPELRAHVAALGFKSTELKRSLGHSRLTDGDAARRYKAAEAEWEAIVAQATKMATKSYDRLDAPTIAYLAATFERDWHLLDERELAARGADFAEAEWAGWEEMLSEYQRWRIDQDVDAMMDRWGSSAQAIVDSERIVLDPNDPSDLQALCSAMNDRAIALSDSAKARLKGKIVAVPDMPQAPQALNAPAPSASGASFETIAQDILDSPRHPIGASTKQMSATALRFFREAFGTPAPATIKGDGDAMARPPIKTSAEAPSLPALDAASRAGGALCRCGERPALSSEDAIRPPRRP